MFTGIVEAKAKLVRKESEGSNVHFYFTCPFTTELKIDQSVSHNGVCLTVVGIEGDEYKVTAIKETLERTNLGLLNTGEEVNLERCMPAHGRFDGHILQGHVDLTAVCESVENENGSWKFFFHYPSSSGQITVEKGSICVNGVSLTVVDSEDGRFSVCIIPYTFEHTNFKDLKAGSVVNLEFDILGKYISKLLKTKGA